MESQPCHHLAVFAEHLGVGFREGGAGDVRAVPYAAASHLQHILFRDGVCQNHRIHGAGHEYVVHVQFRVSLVAGHRKYLHYTLDVVLCFAVAEQQISLDFAFFLGCRSLVGDLVVPFYFGSPDGSRTYGPQQVFLGGLCGADEILEYVLHRGLVLVNLASARNILQCRNAGTEAVAVHRDALHRHAYAHSDKTCLCVARSHLVELACSVGGPDRRTGRELCSEKVEYVVVFRRI